jgi:4'-phosphopantetheinyl transferase
MLDVYWLEQSLADVPKQNDWLSTSDLARLDGMRFEKRRTDWRLGRWTAKRALAARLHLPDHFQSLAEIEIRPALSGAPEVFLANEPAEVTISISHRDGMAICAVAAAGASLGCDLEIVEPRSDAFVADYFTADEQRLVFQAGAADRFQMLALLWSAKESALKAMRIGLRLDTRDVVVNPWVAAAREGQPAHERGSSVGSNCWRPLQVCCRADQVFQGWWRREHNVMRTMVAAPAPFQPTTLSVEDHVSQP